jgi:hypothetical protein
MLNAKSADYCRKAAIALATQALVALETATTEADLAQAARLLQRAMNEASTASQFAKEEE